MRFNNNHRNLNGLHAVFSPSTISWLNYDDAKALEVYTNKKAAEMGTILHRWAKETIDLGIKQAKSKKTLNAYVNDAIQYKMDTEVVLYYSDRFFGTADAISFRNNFLRIHDLKTGKNPADIKQLMIYAALFCLEYKKKPSEIEMELRIYQNDEVLCHNATAEDIEPIMDTIIRLNKLIEQVELGEDY